MELSLVQKHQPPLFRNAMRKIGFHSQWSAPVKPTHDKLTLEPGLRGRAGGTSIHAKFPIRGCFNPLPDDLVATTRVVHTILQLGSLHVQVSTPYGYAASSGGRKEATNHLVSQAIKASKAIPLPSIFVGDFNAKVEDLQSTAELFEQGFVTLQKKYRQLYQDDMPCMCKDVTTPDNAIMHPAIASLVH